MIAFLRVGKALKFLRERSGMSQKSVASAAGVTAPMLSAYENERSLPEIETLDKILSRGLGVGLAELAWALDLVNERAASNDNSRTAKSVSSAPDLEALLRDLGEPLSADLEEGYRLILRGLTVISRTVYESVVRRERDKD
ncbi:MAG TPA: helix-turn-helix transcriptional regulator [Thermoanaerobaculia bacterium]|nr:helix-turn-helix transcriptional regulator [Thermoanaerobaculia bacterium]